jgi:hypothetical protein
MSLGQIQELLCSMYQQEHSEDYAQRRESATQAALVYVSSDQKMTLIREVWANLQQHGEAPGRFMRTAIHEFTLSEIEHLREQAIDSVRELGQNQEVETHLRFLAVTAGRKISSVMPVVQLFEHLFGGTEVQVRLASQWAYQCLNPLKLRADHRHEIARAMADAVKRIDDADLKGEIRQIAARLYVDGSGWRGSTYRKHWERE